MINFLLLLDCFFKEQEEKKERKKKDEWKVERNFENKKVLAAKIFYA